MAKKDKSVEALTHDEAKRKNIPTAEHESVLDPEHQEVKKLRYPRNTDLDPQLVWRGKDEQDWSDLVVPAPPVYIQEKVHPKVLIDDLMRASERDAGEEDEDQVDLFADFNGIPEGVERTDFYEHDQNWSNRMILGDSLQVMASLAEREGLRGQVQCIYIDPPYGIKFNSNFQWSTTSRDVKDGKAEHITREPEQVKAFRDTWRDGTHSYLTYLRDRLTVARDLLAESGSIFVQINDESVHLLRMLLDEVFGAENFCRQIQVAKTSGMGATLLPVTSDYLLWYARKVDHLKYHQLYLPKSDTDAQFSLFREDGHGRLYRMSDLTGQNNNVSSCIFEFDAQGIRVTLPKGRQWKTTLAGIRRLKAADRILTTRSNAYYKRFLDDWSVKNLTDRWDDTASGGFTEEKIYVVQTNVKIIQRCVLMTTDPGDLVLDPTCGSGTTAVVAEEWGRRWITVDTSRVSLALARARIMGARYPFYLLADSPEGQNKEAEITRTAPSTKPTHNNVRHGFVYERVPHITLGSITTNAEIDVIWEDFEERMEPIRSAINAKRGLVLEEWQMPREPGDPWPRKARKQHERFMRVTTDATRQKAVDRVNEIMGRDYTIETFPEHPVDPWSDPELLDLHEKWWELRIVRQKEIDASIAAKADSEYLYDKPYEDPTTVRVAGPFTVESLSPHRTLGVDEDDELIDPLEAKEQLGDYAHLPEFGQMVLENLRTAGVQQAHQEDRIEFISLHGWPGHFICAEGRYQEGATEKRAGIFIGPEFGTVRRSDLVEAAREAGDADFDVVIACAFNYEPHASEFDKLGRIPVLKARMNADLHMADDLKNTGSGNLFVIFGEPDIDLIDEDDEVQVKINGVDVFDPSTGEVRSDDADGIACWFVDTDYNGESFFVRQAYFLGANDPYKSLKTTLKAEIDEDAWASLHSDTSRPFPPPSTGRVAVKVINHLGDEVMKVFRV
jgi:adenine-specific DNA-methyltransferase